METIVSTIIINKSIKGASKNLEFAQMQGAEKILQRSIWLICQQEIFSQRSSWDEIWIFRSVLKFQSQESDSTANFYA